MSKNKTWVFPKVKHSNETKRVCKIFWFSSDNNKKIVIPVFGRVGNVVRLRHIEFYRFSCAIRSSYAFVDPSRSVCENTRLINNRIPLDPRWIGSVRSALKSFDNARRWYEKVVRISVRPRGIKVAQKRSFTMTWQGTTGTSRSTGRPTVLPRFITFRSCTYK